MDDISNIPVCTIDLDRDSVRLLQPQSAAELDKWEAALDEREAALVVRELALDKREAALDEREQENLERMEAICNCEDMEKDYRRNRNLFVISSWFLCLVVFINLLISHL
jgi:hypothetical protein